MGRLKAVFDFVLLRKNSTSQAKSQELYSPAGEPARREVKSTKSKVNAILWDLRGSLIAYVVVTLGFVPCMAMEVGGMKWKAWYTLWVTVVVLVSLVGDVFEDAGLAFLLGLMLLTVAGVITIAEAVAGFGDKLVCAIAADSASLCREQGTS